MFKSNLLFVIQLLFLDMYLTVSCEALTELFPANTPELLPSFVHIPCIFCGRFVWIKNAILKVKHDCLLCCTVPPVNKLWILLSFLGLGCHGLFAFVVGEKVLALCDERSSPLWRSHKNLKYIVERSQPPCKQKGHSTCSMVSSDGVRPAPDVRDWQT